jgi:TetR/AcrR family transcriptional regulator, transcriptional repressor for nem operon
MPTKQATKTKPSVKRSQAVKTKPPVDVKRSAKDKLLDAAVHVVRQKGYAATTVDDLCKEAGVTKGAFFHHFESKEDLGVAAAQYWNEFTSAFFQSAPYHAHKDPLDRVLGYVDFRRQIIQGKVEDFTCLLGTMVQEAYQTSPKIRQACDDVISDHTARVAQDIAAAKTLYVPDATWDPEELALFTQVVLQGSFILAKSKNGPEAADASLLHLRRYIEFLFAKSKSKSKSKTN